MQRLFTQRRLLLSTLSALLCASLFTGCGHSQFTGKWVSIGKQLDNGEQTKMLLDLKQDGTKITGNFQSSGFSMPVDGTANGTHLSLYGPRHRDHPLVEADLVNGTLKGMRGSHPFEATPAGPNDGLPTVAYITPPAIQPVASNGLAKTPPMGWNSWNLFAGKIDDATVRTMADAMVSSGMRDAGYVYINIDDTWEGTRDAQGVLQPNHKFPDMKALADYVHSKGLKLGIYSSPGPRTCAGYPGSYGHEEQDAKTYAAWGIDYLKYDWCSASGVYQEKDLQPVYQKMGGALVSTGRPIVFSLCEYGLGHVETWGPQVAANLWRTTGDIRDEWSSMMGNIEQQVPTAPYAGPGHWNDPDMLEIGNGHMTDDEYRTHMSLWALTAAPLLAGNDLRSMSDVTKSILMNREVIAVDQDALGKQASPVKNGSMETWVKPLANGDVAVGIVNTGGASAKATVSQSDLQLTSVKKARDLWSHKDVSFANGTYSADVPSHGTLLLRVSGK